LTMSALIVYASEGCVQSEETFARDGQRLYRNGEILAYEDNWCVN